MKTFLELDESLFRDARVIIDIDGTLSHDRATMLSQETIEKLQAFGRLADTYLFSNTISGRTQSFAEVAGISFISSLHRKPSRRVIEHLEYTDKPIFVVGDKTLTDGLFAINIGADFVLVKRMRSSKDSVLTRLIYFIDDTANIFMKVFFPVLPYVILMRPTQWIKNFLVFAPVFFAGNFFATGVFTNALVAFFIFCVAASIVYILNDIFDLPQDRLHPTKKMRPLASGKVSIIAANILIGCLLLIVILGLHKIPSFLPVVVYYLILNLLYSLCFKHIAVLDVTLVAFFYVLRIIAGGVATHTYVSHWIILCILFGALFMVVGKRRAEFQRSLRRKVLDVYSGKALDVMLVSSATLALTSYGLYSVLGNTSHYAVYSTIFVAIAIFRMLNSIFADDGEAEYPETLIFRDKLILMSVVFWALFMFVILY